MADPFLIGVSSGAGLGAVVAQSLVARQGLFAPFLRPAFALLGGILVVTAVFLLGRDSAGGAYRTNRLILAGAAMNSFCSALISFVLLYFQNNLRTSMAWMMGGITLSGWVPVRVLIPLVLIGLTGQLVSAYSLNVLQFGDDQASSLGLDAGGVQRRKHGHTVHDVQDATDVENILLTERSNTFVDSKRLAAALAVIGTLR